MNKNRNDDKNIQNDKKMSNVKIEIRNDDKKKSKMSYIKLKRTIKNVKCHYKNSKCRLKDLK